VTSRHGAGKIANLFLQCKQQKVPILPIQMYGGMLLGVRNVQVVTLGSCGHSLIDCVFFAKIYHTGCGPDTNFCARGGRGEGGRRGGGGGGQYIFTLENVPPSRLLR
jgi:hypothetical protein